MIGQVIGNFPIGDGPEEDDPPVVNSGDTVIKDICRDIVMEVCRDI